MLTFRRRRINGSACHGSRAWVPTTTSYALKASNLPRLWPPQGAATRCGIILRFVDKRFCGLLGTPRQKKPQCSVRKESRFRYALQHSPAAAFSSSAQLISGSSADFLRCAECETKCVFSSQLRSGQLQTIAVPPGQKFNLVLLSSSRSRYSQSV
jgi:hypothetical protein